jgi:hypothetical protein
MPVAGLLVMAVTARAGRHYPQHLYFALHVHAVAFAAIAVRALLPAASAAVPKTGSSFAMTADFSVGGGLNALLSAAVGIYVVVAFRRVYGGGWVRNAARAAVASTVYIVLVLAFLFALMFTDPGNRL